MSSAVPDDLDVQAERAARLATDPYAVEEDEAPTTLRSPESAIVLRPRPSEVTFANEAARR